MLPESRRFGSEPPSVEDDVNVWRYAIVSCTPETTTTNAVHSLDYTVATYLSVCLSITCQYCVKMAKRISRLFNRRSF